MNDYKISELTDMVRNFCEAREWDQIHNPKDLAIGLPTESNELLDLFRFKTDEQMSEMMKNDRSEERISEELSDVLFFLLRFSQLYGFDLGVGLKNKIVKNEEKYPLSKAKGANKKYTEF